MGSLIEAHRIRGASVRGAVTAPGVIEFKVASQSLTQFGGRLVGTQYTSAYLTLCHRRSTITLSIQQPLPSMLMAIPWSLSTPVNASEVNCDP